MRGLLRRKSDDTWQARIFRGRDEAGRQLFDYHTVHASTKREAQAALTDLLHGLNAGSYTEPSRITVGEWLETWMSDYASHSVAPYTLDGYRQIVDKRLIPALGAVRLNQLTPTRIQRYYAEELTSGRAKGEGGLSARTVSHHHRLLSAALRRAVRVGILASNPCDRVDPPRAKHVEMKAIDEVSTERMLAAAKNDGHLSLYAAVLLAANAGLRRGEVLGLKWSDLDTKSGVLTVNRTLQEPSTGIGFREPKSASSRRALPLDAVTLKELSRYRTRQKQQRLALGEAWQAGDLICPGDLGEPWRPALFSGAYRAFCHRLGVHVRFHDLRHSHASQLIRAGAPAKVVQERLGHSSAGFTLSVYGHLLPGMQEDAVSKLADARAVARAELRKEASSAV
jgi:integrase